MEDFSPSQPVEANPEGGAQMPPVSPTQPQAEALPQENIQTVAQNSVNEAQPTVVPSVQQAPAQTAPPQIPVETDEKVWAAVSYLPLMAVLALIVKPQSAYVKLHGRQGLLLFGIFFVSLFGFGILLMILPDFIIEYLISPLWILFSYIALPVLGIYSMYHALVGNWWKIPVLGDIAEKIPVGKFTQLASSAISGQPVDDQQNDQEQFPK